MTGPRAQTNRCPQSTRCDDLRRQARAVATLLDKSSRWRQALRRRLLAWYRRHARELPWRGTRDPYAIWVSEIMLQQTQVATVIPYFRRFLARFPNDRGAGGGRRSRMYCAEWEGLGYYRRARQLHRAARIVADEHGGRFPRDIAGVRQLPGIGRYTAGAILSIAFDARLPIVEANTLRLLSRLLGISRRSAQSGRPAAAVASGRGAAAAAQRGPLQPGLDGAGQPRLHSTRSRLPRLPAIGALRSAASRARRENSRGRPQAARRAGARSRRGRAARATRAPRTAKRGRTLGRAVGLSTVCRLGPKRRGAGSRADRQGCRRDGRTGRAWRAHRHAQARRHPVPDYSRLSRRHGSRRTERQWTESRTTLGRAGRAGRSSAQRYRPKTSAVDCSVAAGSAVVASDKRLALRSARIHGATSGPAILVIGRAASVTPRHFPFTFVRLLRQRQ